MSLGLAVDDLEAGHYGTDDRERLAGYLDNVAAALRDCGDVVGGQIAERRSARTSS